MGGRTRTDRRIDQIIALIAGRPFSLHRHKQKNVNVAASAVDLGQNIGPRGGGGGGGAAEALFRPAALQLPEEKKN